MQGYVLVGRVLTRVRAGSRTILHRSEDVCHVGTGVGTKFGTSVERENGGRRSVEVEKTFFGDERVVEDDEAGGVVDPFNLEATFFVLPFGKDGLDVSGLHFGVESG